MKKSLLFLAALLPALCLSARVLTPEEALSRAETELSSQEAPIKLLSTSPFQAAPLLTIENSGQPTVYMFGKHVPGEYLVVSADDAVEPILGYGSSNYGKELTENSSFRYWLDEYSRQIAYQRANPAYVDKAEKESLAAARAARQPIAPLVKTHWNQDAPYNDLCPAYNGSRSVTGCVATALAQVMKYHNYPLKGAGSISYTDNGQTVSFNFGETEFDWTNMLDTYGSDATAAQNKAVATLMYACGASVKMSYSPVESGAASASVPGALVEYFNYDKGVHFMSRDYYGLEEWEDAVYDNLVNYGPVQYSGQSSDGGHSFVCDGYSSDGYFHINWGWGGMSDGYFLLTALDPGSQGIGGSTSGYNYNQDIIAAVQAPTAENKLYEQVYAGADFAPGQTSVALGNSVSFTGGYYNMSAAPITAVLGIKVVGADGNVQYIEGPQMNDVPVGSGYTQYSVTLPSSMAAGIYTVTPAFMTTSGVWEDIPVKLSAIQSLTMTVADGTATFAPGKVSSLAITEVAAKSAFYIGSKFKVSANFANSSDNEYYGAVALALINSQGQLVGLGASYPVDLQGGESQTVDYISQFAVPSSTTLSAGGYKVCFVNPETGAQMSDMIDITLNASVETTLNASHPDVKDATAVDPEDFEVSCTVHCLHGYFGNSLTLAVFPDESTSGSVTSVATFQTETIFLSEGQSTTVTVKGNFSNAVPGKRYFCALYNGQTPVTKLNGYFTVKNTPLGVIDVEVAPAEVRLYNLQGIRMTDDIPVAGIYIREKIYQDGHIIRDRVAIR